MELKIPSEIQLPLTQAERRTALFFKHQLKKFTYETNYCVDVNKEI